jgi:hypothetical protein
MESQQIILMRMSRFLKEMLERGLATLPGIRIVDEVPDWAGLPAAIQQTGAQWVIVSLPPGDEMPEAANLVLAKHPAIRILNVAADGGHVTLKWIEPHEQSIDEFSMNELLMLLTNPTQAGARQA